MKQTAGTLAVLLIFLGWAVGTPPPTDRGQDRSAQLPSTQATSADIFSLDLTQLALPSRTIRTIHVENEALFFRPAHYQAIDFDSLLRQAFPIDELKPLGCRIFFRTHDNHNVSLSLDQVLSGGGYLAGQDIAASLGGRWQPLEVDGSAKDLRLFLLGLDCSSCSRPALIWPYDLETVLLVAK